MSGKPWDRLGLARVKERLKLRMEPIARALSLIPKLMLFIACASLLLYALGKMLEIPEVSRMASATTSQSVYQILSVVFFAFLALINKAFGALATPTEITAASVGALIFAITLIATVFSWRTAIYLTVACYVISIVMGILLLLTRPFLGLETIMPEGLRLGSGIADLLLYGFLGLLNFSHVMLRMISGWVASQFADVLFLATTMSLLGFAAMYVDKRGVDASRQIERLPEIASDQRLSHERKMEIVRGLECFAIPEKDLVRYALLGGGLGVLAGALLFRHKTENIGFLAWVTILTIASLWILSGGV